MANWLRCPTCKRWFGRHWGFAHAMKVLSLPSPRHWSDHRTSRDYLEGKV